MTGDNVSLFKTSLVLAHNELLSRANLAHDKLDLPSTLHLLFKIQHIIVRGLKLIRILLYAV